MIVKCERCQTRFKIPDEKVTDKGVKVRCTKCQNTFRVTREASVADTGLTPASSPAGEADPFARFGVAQDPKGVEITKPGYFAQGVEASRRSPASSPSRPWNSVDGDLDTEAGVFHEPTRVGPMPLPPAARPPATPFDSPRSAGAVPLPAPVRTAGPPVGASTGLYGAPVAPVGSSTGLYGAPVAPVGSSTGLYGSAVPPPSEDPFAAGGAVPLPGVAGPRGGIPSAGAGGAVPLPGVAGPRGGAPVASPGGAPLPPAFASSGQAPSAPAPMAPGRVPPASSAGPSMPAPVTMFGPSRGGAAAPAAVRGAAPASAPVSGARPPPPPGASAPAGFAPAPVPGRGPSPASTGSAQPRRGAAPAAPSPIALSGADPFADLLGGSGPAGDPGAGPVFDDLPAPRAPAAEALRRAAAPPPASAPTGAVALGPVRPASAGPVASSSPATPFQGEDPFASIDIDVAAAPPAPPKAAAASALTLPEGEDPFASIDIDDVSTAAPAGVDPFASIGGGPSRPAPAPAASPVSPPAGVDPFESIDLEEGPSRPAAPPAAASPSAPGGRALAAPLPPPPSANALFDLSSDSDAFGEHSGMQPTDTGRAALLGTPPPSAEADPFALGSEPSGGSLLGDVPPVDEAQEFTVTLGNVGAPAAGALEVLDVAPVDAPAVTVARPTARPEDVGIPQSRPPSRALKVTALVANLVIAAALVVGLGAVGRVYLREGRVDLSVLSPAHLRTLVVPAPRPLVAVDVSNALYETRDGRSLFIVRGEAENRTSSATRIRVRAALYDGSQRVRSAEALAGALPTPEDLYAVGNSESAAALSQRVDSAATSVAPGAKAPFLVMFHEYPADLGDFRLEVTLEPVSGTE